MWAEYLHSVKAAPLISEHREHGLPVQYALCGPSSPQVQLLPPAYRGPRGLLPIDL